MKVTLTLAAAALAVLLSSAVNSKIVVREFSGSKGVTTVPFTVDGPWLLDWRLDADYEQMIALDISLIDARTGMHLGRVLHTKYKGNGVKLFDEGGAYRLRISATLARWRIKIQQITPEEAELYTPRKDNKSN
jgi:hypothetical protein